LPDLFLLHIKPLDPRRQLSQSREVLLVFVQVLLEVLLDVLGSAEGLLQVLGLEADGREHGRDVGQDLAELGRLDA
jgi:hypothetical protein